MKRWSIGAAVVLCLGLTGVAQAAGPPTQLTVGDREAPLNVGGHAAVRLDAGQRQGQRRPDRLPAHGHQGRRHAVWDSGKVASSAQSYVPYGGPALEPRRGVRVDA